MAESERKSPRRSQSAIGHIGKKKKRHRKKKDQITSIPGVFKIILTEQAQKDISCVVGEDVTCESPWKSILKEDILDNLEFHDHSSEFLPIKKQIMKYPEAEILIGYLADETKDFEEFVICLTVEAKTKVTAIIKERQEEQEKRLMNSVLKTITRWSSLGSEYEVDGGLITNNRPLMEIEVESRFPIHDPKTHIKFCLRKTDHVRDGYIELRPSADDSLNSIYKLRIDNVAQAAASLKTAEVQTTACEFVHNNITQYSLDFLGNVAVSTELNTAIKAFKERYMEQMSELLKTNSGINLYVNDYNNLVLDLRTTKDDINLHYAEFMSFMDVKRCQGKMIVNMCWHPMISGVIAVTYGDLAKHVYQTEPITIDEVNEAVYGLNLVLMYTLNDPVWAKLTFEAPREVTQLKFCDYDENILIGGCKNGQIILWDIKNKLAQVENVEFLTPAQQDYRKYMHSLIYWMKNVHSTSNVKVTALSDFKNSHKGTVTGIKFLPQNHCYSKTGKLYEMGGGLHSYQFMTSSDDGTILIWDLLEKPKFQSGGFKPRKFKRLPKKPSALMSDESPYRILHLNIKPLYRIQVSILNKVRGLMFLSSVRGPQIEYTEVGNISKYSKRTVMDRIMYKAKSKPVPLDKCVVHVGTIDGLYDHITWEGQEYDSGEVVNSETVKGQNYSVIHDGPVVQAEYSNTLDSTMSVGGKIFALWCPSFKDGPILWRKINDYFSWGKWNQSTSSRNILIAESGILSMWSFHLNSLKPLFTENVGNCIITGNESHPRKLDYYCNALGDERGFVRMLMYSSPTHLEQQDEIERMKKFLNREMNAKLAFLQWQKKWNETHEELIRGRKILQEAQEVIVKEEQQGNDAEQKKIPILTMLEKMKLFWNKYQKERIAETIKDRKQTDRKKLEKMKKPLQKIDQENQKKKQKQRATLKEADNIFNEVVRSMFPDYFKKLDVAAHDPYAGGDSIETKKKTYDDYLAISERCDKLITTKGYSYHFNWRKTLQKNRDRSKAMRAGLRGPDRREMEAGESNESNEHHKEGVDEFEIIED